VLTVLTITMPLHGQVFRLCTGILTLIHGLIEFLHRFGIDNVADNG